MISPVSLAAMKNGLTLSNVMNKWLPRSIFRWPQLWLVFVHRQNLSSREMGKQNSLNCYLCWILFQFIRFAFRLNLLPVHWIYYLTLRLPALDEIKIIAGLVNSELKIGDKNLPKDQVENSGRCWTIHVTIGSFDDKLPRDWLSFAFESVSNLKWTISVAGLLKQTCHSISPRIPV